MPLGALSAPKSLWEAEKAGSNSQLAFEDLEEQGECSDDEAE